MSEMNNSQADGNKLIFPDFAELWKEMYFKTETAWADAFKEFVSTDTFVKMLDQSLTQHLSMEKVNRQYVDKLFEYSAAPSKKDLARIAELVISVEEKIDNLDYQLLDNINTMAASLIMMADSLEKTQLETAATNSRNADINNRVDEMQGQTALLQEQIAEVIIQNKELIKQMSSINQQNGDLKNQLIEFKKQNTQLKTQVTDMKKQVTIFNQKLTVLNGESDGSSKKTSSSDLGLPVAQAELKQAPLRK